MTTGKRNRPFLKARGHTNPGPGTYADNGFVDKNTAPSFGFGSAKREPDYMSASKKQIKVPTPGPGAYKIP